MATPDMLKRLAPGRIRYIYNVKFVCGFQKNPIKDDECGAILSRGIYSTEINILNYGPKDITIFKAFTPVVIHNKAIAREPKIQGPIGFEKVDLKRLHATMDDCCKIVDMLKEMNADAQLKIGFIEILSPVPIEVYAVYTVTNIEQTNPTISVVQVEGRNFSGK